MRFLASVSALSLSVSALAEVGTFQPLWISPSSFNSLMFSSDGKMLVSNNEIFVDTSEKRVVRIDASPFGSLSPDLRFRAGISGDGLLVTTADGVLPLAYRPNVRNLLAWFPNSSKVLFCDTDKKLRIADAPNLDNEKTLPVDGEHAWAKISQYGPYVHLSYPSNGIYSLITGAFLWPIGGWAGAFSPSGTYFHLENQQVVERNLATGFRRIVTPMLSNPYRVDVSPDGSKLAIGLGSTVALLSAATGQVIAQRPVMTYPSQSLFDPTGRFVSFGAAGGLVLSSSDLTPIVPGIRYLAPYAVSPNGRWLAMANYMLDLAFREPAFAFEDYLAHPKFNSASDRLLNHTTWSTKVHIVPGGQVVSVLPHAAESRISPDGSLVALRIGTGWSIYSVESQQELYQTPSQTYDVEFLPDNKHLVANMGNAKQLVCRNADGVAINTLTNVWSFVPHPDGKSIYVESTNKTDRLRVADGTVIESIPGSKGVRYVTSDGRLFAQDGRRLYEIRKDGSIVGETDFSLLPAPKGMCEDGSVFYTDNMRAFMLLVRSQDRIARSIAVRAQLEDFEGSLSGLAGGIEVLDPVSGEKLLVPGVLDSAGRMIASIKCDGNPKDVRVKVGHWLSSVHRGAEWGVGMFEASVTLHNGDVDEDNAVTLFDYAAFSDAFDSSPGDTRWNPNADLDGDGAVTVFDYEILNRNFDQVGE